MRAIGLALLVCWIGSACTWRYSQTLVGDIRQVQQRPVENEDSGIQVFGITFTEPRSAHELLSIPCDSPLVQTDYRGVFYYFVLIPSVQTTTYCVK